MKRRLALLALCAFPLGLPAQVADTTVCEVLKNPQSFNGKIVRIKGTVSAGLDQFVIKGQGCGHYINAIWLSYPEGTKAKAGPVAMVQLQAASNFSGKVEAPARPPVTLDKNKDFKQFDSLLSAPHKAAGMCLGCTRYEVNATLVGRMDGVADPGVSRDAAGKITSIGGFGNLNAYGARLVLQSVSDISPQEVDFSKNDAINKNDATPDSQGGDAYESVEVAHKAAQTLGAATPQGVQVERAAQVFGKQNEHNGVVIGFGAANEASAKAEAQAAHDSPDGVLYNCTFNTNRVQGAALTMAVVHLGQHIADVRNPSAGSDKALLFELEYQAWVTSALTAVITGQRSLTLPGSYLLWNSAWPVADRGKMMDENLTAFLSAEELLSR